jgi:hypothetical protein
MILNALMVSHLTTDTIFTIFISLFAMRMIDGITVHGGNEKILEKSMIMKNSFYFK